MKRQAMPTESPVLVLTKDKKRLQQLNGKLAEYRGRRDPQYPPEMQMDTICKIAVLERLLRDSRVNTWEFSRELASTYGTSFDVEAFNNACAVVEDYCQTGGQIARGGTGL